MSLKWKHLTRVLTRFYIPTDNSIMKKLLFAALFMVSASAMAQEEKGMHFEHDQNWAEIKAKALAENKFIFVDAFTTWCGPCKMMAANIFPQDSVGAFYNANFINLKVQLDTTKKDNDKVKAWYQDARDIKQNYKVNVFPTYLFFSPKGELVHRAVGSSEASVFINKGKDALDPDKQYYTLAQRFIAGEKEPSFLLKLANAALQAYEREGIAKYSAAYLATQKDLLTEQNIRFLNDFTQTSKDPGFNLMVKNPAAFNKVLGEGKAENRIKSIVLQEEVYPVVYGGGETPNWTDFQKSLSAKYPGLANELVSEAKVIYYNSKGDWTNFCAAFTAHLKAYGKKTSAQELNQYAWTVFENCDDIACVKQAVEWSKKSVDLTNNPMFIDTYANLLHKTGSKAEAIKWQQKAITILKENKEDAAEYEATLEKIKKNEKTW
jgi:thiol-disulfide isomerase/thioredoxin